MDRIQKAARIESLKERRRLRYHHKKAIAEESKRKALVFDLWKRVSETLGVPEDSETIVLTDAYSDDETVQAYMNAVEEWMKARRSLRRVIKQIATKTKK